MIRLWRSVQRGLNYIKILVSALLRQQTRQQLRGLIQLLQQSKTHFGTGDLPSLMSFLDHHVRENSPIRDASYLLRLAEGVAAFYSMPKLRYCMRRTILRYSVLQGHQQGASFVIGVDRNRTELIGHAWIEIEGMAFEEYDDMHQKMVVIYRHP
jgi:hypothetical protein